MPKPPSHPRYQAVARSEPYPSRANRSGGGHNNHGGGGHGHSGLHGSTGMMYHHAAGSMNTTAGVTPGVPPPAHQQSTAPPNFGYGANPGIGARSGPGAGTGMMNPQYATATITATPRTIPRNFDGQQSSPSSSTSTYGQQPSFGSLQGPSQPHNSSPSSAPNFQLTGYQQQSHPLQQPLHHQSFQHHPQHQQHQHSPTIVNQNAAHPTHFPPQPQQQQRHQPPSHPHHHQPHRQPPQSSANPPAHNNNNNNPNSPSPSLHNPTTSWTPREDALLLSSRASQLPWSELQRLHFPGKTANACRKRHERLIEKRQAEEEVDEDRLARIAGEYVRMRGELWQGLAERIGMDVKEVEERCLGMGVGRLKVAGRRGGRRRGSYPVAATGMAGMGPGPVSTVMPMMFSQSQGQGQGDTEEGRNYTHSPVQIGSTGAGQPMIGPGPGHGIGMGAMLPPQTAPPLTTLVPIPPPTTTGHGYNVNTSALPTSSAPSIPPPPLLPLMQQQQQQQQQQQPRVMFGGYLNGRSSSRRPTHPLPCSSAPPLASTSALASASASVPVSANTNLSGGFDQGQGQGQGQQWPRQGGVNPAGSVGMGMGVGMTVPVTSTPGPPTLQTWHNGGGGGGGRGGGGGYPPSSFG